MIKNIIFDLGGVIITIDQPEAVRRFASLGLPDAEKALDPYTQSGIFGDLEAGKITDEEFRVAFSQLVGREVTWEECQYGWLGYRKELPRRNVEILKRLRQEGYRLILLSNTNSYMMHWAESPAFDGEGHTLSHYFDAAYKSYQVKLMKPDARFFQYVLKQENILPSETLFVDDGAHNIEAAANLGLHTFQPVNGEDWTSDIFQYLTGY